MKVKKMLNERGIWVWNEDKFFKVNIDYGLVYAKLQMIIGEKIFTY